MSLVEERDTEKNDEGEEENEVKPFDWPSMCALCIGMLAHSVVFTAPLPFVAFMVVDFGMADNLDDAGYAAGWITGCFMIGRTVAGIAWGMASDRCIYLMTPFHQFFFLLIVISNVYECDDLTLVMMLIVRTKPDGDDVPVCC